MSNPLKRIHGQYAERRAAALLLSIAVLCAATARHSAQEPQYDLLIAGGHIIDGSGNPWFEGSVAVEGGRIAGVGRLVKATARRVIDASGLVVAPGFIDLHSHSDFTLLVDGTAQSKIRQGVTTEILGEAESAGPIEGIPYVIVNGVVVIDQGQQTGAKPGRVLHGRGKRL